MSITAARMHRRMIRYRTAFRSLIVFTGAFLVTFIVASENNPVGELHAESIQMRGTVNVSPQEGFVPPENTQMVISTDAATNTNTYTVFTTYVKAEDE